MKPLILASSSSYRKRQLKSLGWPFESHSPKLNEEEEKKKIKKNNPRHFHKISESLAWKKALSLKPFFPNSIIIGGDQILEFKGSMFTKPFTTQKALLQLRSLSNETHRLLTSICILYKKKTFLHTEVGFLFMRKLSDKDLKNYIKKDRPLKCCGSYKIERSGVTLFHKIQCEDFSSLMGLPLIFLTDTLLKLNFNPYSGELEKHSSV